jgi:hypothetical protein
MDITIKDNKFTINKLEIKPCKNCIKLIYDLTFLKLIGISFKIKNYKVIKKTNSYVKLLIQDEITIKNIKKIDTYLSNIYPEYMIMLNNNEINVKNHDEKKTDTINININNLKKNNDNKYYTQIYELNG